MQAHQGVNQVHALINYIYILTLIIYQANFVQYRKDQGSPMDRPPGGSRGVNLGGGSSGSTDNPTSKKIPFFTTL